MKANEVLEFERGLPAALDAERFVLGSLLHSPGAFAAIQDQLSADDFTVESHRRIWAAMNWAESEQREIEQITIAQRLSDTGQLEAVGGLTYLLSLDESLPQMFNLDAYVRIVLDKAVLRRVIAAMERVKTEAFLGQRPAEDILASARAAVDGILATQEARQPLESVGEIITRYGGIEAFLSPDRQNAESVMVPWAALGSVMYSLRESELTIVAARPGVGKTAFAAQLAVAAAQQGKAAACFSMEMDAREYLSRMIATGAQINLHRHRKYGSSDEQRQKLALTAGELDLIPLYTDARTGTSVANVYAAVQRLQSKQQVGVVIVDYLQLISAESSRGNRNEAVASVARDLKLMASRLSVHVVALSQLTREAEKFWNEGRDPENFMLLDSGGIEAAANNIIFLWPDRDGYRACKAGDAQEMLVNVWVTKQRSGPQGVVQLRFTPRFTRFEDA